MNKKILFCTFFVSFLSMHNLYGMAWYAAQAVFGHLVKNDIREKILIFAQRQNIDNQVIGLTYQFKGANLSYVVLSGLQENTRQTCLKNQPGDLGLFFVEASSEEIQNPNFEHFCVGERDRCKAVVIVLKK